MVTVGFAAPKFDCRAVVHGTIRRLRWRQVHEDKTLLLLFDASTAGGPANLIVLNQAAGRLHALQAKLIPAGRGVQPRDPGRVAACP